MNTVTHAELEFMNRIEGVEIKTLKSHPDDRGFFREIIRHSDPFFPQNSFGQWSHSAMGKNTVKAWHFHHKQTDWWYCGVGVLEAVLFDNREESPTYKNINVFYIGDKTLDARATESVIRIPPGVLHGLKVLTETAHLFYVTSHTYDPQDEGRIPYDSELVPHSWGQDYSKLIVAANDRKLFVPAYPRVKV
ncbi:dTDP-4-dehydrorhamnose 3,5-epimerase family protein [bacterium]|nr:dTDP-4-dehydrorhamnose 3,5-epimerase family protein [bacterium]